MCEAPITVIEPDRLTAAVQSTLRHEHTRKYTQTSYQLN